MHISWGNSKRSEFNSALELETLIQATIDQAEKSNLPVAVEIMATPDTALFVVLGGTVSHLEYSSEIPNQVTVVSHGPWANNEIFEFDVGDERASIELKYCVPMTDAQEAVRQYVNTGNRPTIITWG